MSGALGRAAPIDDLDDHDLVAVVAGVDRDLGGADEGAGAEEARPQASAASLMRAIGGASASGAVEVELALFDLGADLGADRLPGVEVPLADEGDGRPLAPGPAGAADAVDVRVGVLGDVEAEDVRQVGDVEAAAGDVGGDEELDLAGAEGGQGAIALALREPPWSAATFLPRRFSVAAKRSTPIWVWRKTRRRSKP